MYSKLFRFAALALAIPLASCEEIGIGAQTGSISILLTDAPGDIRSAVVTISEIYLQGGEEGGGRVVLMSRDTTLDLLTLANDAATLVEDEVVPAGTYSQLRFVVTGAYIEVENGSGGTTVYATPGYAEVPAEPQVSGNLICPSCAQTGIKVNFPGGIQVDGGQTVILIDFDVSRSFGHQAGASGNWVMHPVINGADLQTSGTITATLALGAGVTLPTIGETQLTLAAFQARLEDDEGADQGSVAFEEVGGVWQARFQFLLPGEYVLRVEAPEGVTATVDPASAPAPLAAGATPVVAFTLLSATAD